MKNRLIFISLVGILCVIAYFLFNGKDYQRRVSSLRKSNQTKTVSQLSPKVTKTNSNTPSKAKLIAANKEAAKPESVMNTRRESGKSIDSEREKRMESKNRFDSPDMFAKIQKMIRTREGFPEPTYHPNYKFIELKKMMSSTKSLKKTSNLNWVERGPANVGGRTRGIVVDPDDALKNTWYAGSVGGGVWKTVNAGTSWRCLTDALPNLATTVVVQAQSNRNVIYAGTGEGFYNADAIAGDGIFKSTDRGESWTQLVSTTNNNDFAYVNRLVIDPLNENVLVAATRTGILKSVDGGTSWSKKSSFGNVEQVIVNPLNFKTLYAAANGNGVIKSFDAGETWFATDNKNLSGSRMEIAIAPSDTSKLYLSSEMSAGSSLFGTTNGGTNWIEIKEKSGTTYDWLGGQGWYDNTIAVNPYDANIIFLGGIDLWKVSVVPDTAAVLVRNSVPITDAYGQYSGSQAYIHPDQHNIVCVPMDSTNKTFKMINGNDGGVALSTDGGTTFKEVGNNGYNTAQFYGADKMTGAHAYFGGTQDNGTWVSDPAKGDATASTKYSFVIGGDGFEVVWNPKDPLKMIGGYQYNGLYRTVDGWKTSEAPTTGFDDYGNDLTSPFITKIAGSKQDPDLLFVISNKGVYRSDNFAENWVLTPIPTSFFPDSSGGYITFAQVTISTATPQVVWAGVYMSSRGKVNVSKDGGLSFTATNNYSKSMGLLSGLDTHPTDPATAFATFSYQGAPKILRTTDYGGVWSDITGFDASTTSTNGFPDVATYCVLVMPYNTNIIWAGTEIGIIESTDNGVSWHYSNNGFPAAAVWDMKIVDDEVVLATHGRGIWSVSLPELANYTPAVVTLSPRINGSIYQTTNGLIINASLRSPYDSTQVFVDGVNQFTFAATTIKDSSLTVPYSGSGLKKFQLVSYKGGVQYKSASISTTPAVILAARKGYTNDFNVATNDFSGDFEIKTAPGFSSGAINSPHPYGINKNFIYSLLVPIIVAGTNATLQYDDIAIVEPGEPGSVYGGSDFYDYVVVEASNGGNWIPLLPGYDCRANASWLSAFNVNASGTPSMFVTHTVNLLDHFSTGDQIMIRFRLFADPGVDGWGWAIDNLKIQEALVGVDKENIPTQFDLAQNYPNPFNPSTIIKYSLPKEEKVTLKIYNNVGQLVATLVNELQNAGEHRVTFNAGKLASGVYFYKIEAGAFNQTKKLILMK